VLGDRAQPRSASSCMAHERLRSRASSRALSATHLRRRAPPGRATRSVRKVRGDKLATYASGSRREATEAVAPVASRVGVRVWLAAHERPAPTGFLEGGTLTDGGPPAPRGRRSKAPKGRSAGRSPRRHSSGSRREATEAVAPVASRVDASGSRPTSVPRPRASLRAAHPRPVGPRRLGGAGRRRRREGPLGEARDGTRLVRVARQQRAVAPVASGEIARILCSRLPSGLPAHSRRRDREPGGLVLGDRAQPRSRVFLHGPRASRAHGLSRGRLVPGRASASSCMALRWSLA
jgi:hypothetical protein